MKFFAYVDEAGDEGFGKLRDIGTSGQSRWLCLGAIVTTDANDAFFPSWRDEICALFPSKQNKKEIHFKTLNHAQRLVACQRIAEKPLGICVIASNKETILDSEELDTFKEKQHLYNYLVRFLMERLTEACAEKASGQTASLYVTFSRRAGTDYQKMRDYFEFMRDGREKQTPVRRINWDIFDPANIRVENHSVRAGLQIADIVTSATYHALEPDQFGNCEPRYSLAMKARYLHKLRKIENHGLTIVPAYWKSPLSENQMRYLGQMKRR